MVDRERISIGGLNLALAISTWPNPTGGGIIGRSRQWNAKIDF